MPLNKISWGFHKSLKKSFPPTSSYHRQLAPPFVIKMTCFINSYSTVKKMPFSLSEDFLEKYKSIPAPFGFNGLGEMVYRRTYARVKPNGQSEQWWETVHRVVNGTYSMQKRWIDNNNLEWREEKAQASAQIMYDRIFNMKFLPPGRGLWAMGSPLTEERNLYATLNNCAFVSTKDMWSPGTRPSEPFTFLMEASMLGVGVGFDVKGADDTFRQLSVVKKPSEGKLITFSVSDTREGWIEGTGLLIDSYFDLCIGKVSFDYSKVRPAGLPIKGFGGISSGPEPLQSLHQMIIKILDENIGMPLKMVSIVDIMNLIGKCVVSGNVRRSAEIAFGDPYDEEYIDLKNYDKNPQRMEYGWTSNNSVYAELGMNYDNICHRIVKNGEPGFAWMENARAFGRMLDPPNFKDARAMGGNPCLEQTLEPYELCCLVETFPYNHTSLEDFKTTLKYAILYAKTVTLGQTQWQKSNQVMLRNRRIGCSMSGIAQFISHHGLPALKSWCEGGYNEIQRLDSRISEWLVIPKSIKTTSIKPSGTVSLLAGATPGMHYPESRFCIRRVRISKNSDFILPLKEAGYHVEPAFGDNNSMVVEFPIDTGVGLRSIKNISMWEQLSLASFLQKYWADNQVSCTITFNPKTESHQLKHALEYFQYQLKGISFLPHLEQGAYPQMPYEAISVEKFREMVGKLKHFQSSYDVVPQLTNEVTKKELPASMELSRPNSFSGEVECSSSHSSESVSLFHEVNDSGLVPEEADLYCDGGKCEIRL